MYGVWRRVLAALVAVTAAAACSSGDRPEVTGATVPTEATTSTTLSVEQEVEQAYLRAFDIYVKAVRDLDTRALDDAYADVALATTLQEIEDLRAAGTPVRYEVEDHAYEPRIESPTRVVMQVRYLNHSVLLNMAGEPIEQDPNERLTYEYVLEKRNGQWFVVNVS